MYLKVIAEAMLEYITPDTIQRPSPEPQKLVHSTCAAAADTCAAPQHTAEAMLCFSRQLAMHTSVRWLHLRGGLSFTSAYTVESHLQI